MSKKSNLRALLSKIEHQTITDRQHPSIQDWSYLRSSNSHRQKSRQFQVEGLRAVEWFLKNRDFALQTIIVAVSEVQHRGKEVQARISEILTTASEQNITLVEVDRDVYRKLADVSKPRGLMAIARHDIQTSADLLENLKEANGIAIATVGINDAGNMGTLIRSGLAFGARAIFALDGSVDPYHPKVLRASTGHMLPAIRAAWQEFRTACRKKSIQVIGVDNDHQAQAISTGENVDKWAQTPLVLCIGSEGKGFPDHARDFDHTVYIPMTNEAQSLNAAVAGSLVLWILHDRPQSLLR